MYTINHKLILTLFLFGGERGFLPLFLFFLKLLILHNFLLIFIKNYV
nr:MAG TPA: hypothetical protein [Caudoviricetes sp.]